MELLDATEKNPGETGNRSRDLPTCSLNHYAVPGPIVEYHTRNILLWYNINVPYSRSILLTYHITDTQY
jgi:hypothetical protein